MSLETAAREKIDALLVAAGWAAQDYKAFNSSAARGVALRDVLIESARCDYLLLVDRIPLGMIEAKKKDTTLYGVTQRSSYYGESLRGFLAALLPSMKATPSPTSPPASRRSSATIAIPGPVPAAS